MGVLDEHDCDVEQQYELEDIGLRDTVLYGEDGHMYVWCHSGGQGRIDETGASFYRGLLSSAGTLLADSEGVFVCFSISSEFGFRRLPPNIHVDEDGNISIGSTSVPLPPEGSVLNGGGIVYRVRDGRLERDENTHMIIGARRPKIGINMPLNVSGQSDPSSVMLLSDTAYIGEAMSRIALYSGVTRDQLELICEDPVFRTFEVADIDNGQSLGVFERVLVEPREDGTYSTGVEWIRRDFPFAPESGGYFYVDMISSRADMNSSFEGLTRVEIRPDGTVWDVAHNLPLTREHMRDHNLAAESVVFIPPGEGEKARRIEGCVLTEFGFWMPHNYNPHDAEYPTLFNVLSLYPGVNCAEHGFEEVA